LKTILSLIFTIFFSLPLFADDNIIEVEPISKTKQVISILYLNNHTWVYERFLIETNKLQEKLVRRTFETKKQALDFIKPQNNLLNSQNKFFNSNNINRVSTENSNQKVWQDTNEWSSAWEKKYSQWFKDNVTKDFFVKYEIATDCADAAIAFRWIFSRINSLPAGQTLAGTDTLFTNRSFKNKWKKLRRSSVWYKDRVFMASLRYLVSNTYTHSLKRDSYPVAITPEHLSEGAYRLTFSGRSGHTVLIHRQNVNGVPLSSLNSTVPKKVRSLSESIFIPNRIETRKEGGLVKHLWIVKKSGRLVKVRPRDMPGYSLEQYDSEFGKDNFSVAVLYRIDPNFNPVKVYENLYESTVDFVKARVSVVAEGNAFCKANDCSPGTQNYEDWSTPSRDKQLKEKMKKERSLYYSFLAISDELGSIRSNKIIEKNIEILGEKYSYKFLKEIWEKKYYNSDPRASLGQRWALSAKNFVSSAVEKINKYEKPLLEKLSQNGCRSESDCPKFSKAWDKEQTIFERAVIKTYLNDILSYCVWKEVPCSEYYLNNVKDVILSGSDFYKYANFIYTGSFDPHSGLDEEKGVRENWDTVFLMKPTYSGLTKSYLVVQDNYGSSYVSLKTKVRKILPIDGTIFTSSEKSEGILFQSKQKDILYLNIDLGEPVSVYKLEKDEVVNRAYINDEKIILSTSSKLTYLDMSSGKSKELYAGNLNERWGNEVFHSASTKIRNEKFYLVSGRTLFIINLKTDEVIKRLIPMQVKEDSFTIGNISNDYIYVKNHSSDDYYRTLIFDNKTAELKKVLFLDDSIDWFYGSDIYKSPIDDNNGFTLKQINNNHTFDVIRKCSPCSGYISNSNLRYTDGDNPNQSLWYFDGVNVESYKFMYDGLYEVHDNYVVEKSDKGKYFVMNKGSQQIEEIKYQGYKNSRITKFGLSLGFRGSFSTDYIQSYDVDYLYSTERGEYIPFDSALVLAYPEGTSDEVISQYSYLKHQELYNKNILEGANIINEKVDHLQGIPHTGSFYYAGNFTFWLNIK